MSVKKPASVEKNLIGTVKAVINILSQVEYLRFNDPQLPVFNVNTIDTPIGNVLAWLLNQKSPLMDEFINLELLEKLTADLIARESFVRLNHIGLCYKVDSLLNEQQKLKKLVKLANTHLYQETSNDEGSWFFIGNAVDWQRPLTELIPVQSTIDQYVDYWLPHIQIDIDTNLSAEQIMAVIQKNFHTSITPFPIKIDGVTYIVRNRLGVSAGVNIFLDLATNNRRAEYLRRKLWKQLL